MDKSLRVQYRGEGRGSGVASSATYTDTDILHNKYSCRNFQEST